MRSLRTTVAVGDECARNPRIRSHEVVTPPRGLLRFVTSQSFSPTSGFLPASVRMNIVFSVNDLRLIIAALGGATVGALIAWLFVRKSAAAAAAQSEARLRADHAAEILQLS